jgi:hypothetical protein
VKHDIWDVRNIEAGFFFSPIFSAEISASGFR